SVRCNEDVPVHRAVPPWICDIVHGGLRNASFREAARAPNRPFAVPGSGTACRHDVSDVPERWKRTAAQLPERFSTGLDGSEAHSAMEPSYMLLFLLPSTSLTPNQATEAQWP